MRKQLILEFLTDKISASALEIAEHLDVKPSQAKAYLMELDEEDLIE